MNEPLQHARMAALANALKLERIATDWPAVAQDVVRANASLDDFLERLLTAETEARAKHQRSPLLELATLPAVKTLEQLDFGFASGAPRAQRAEQAGLAFIERAESAVLLGPSGVGKNHLAIAPAYRAIPARIKTRFITAPGLTMQLPAAKAQAHLREYFNRAILGPRLLIVDEIGHVPSGRGKANLSFKVAAKRYERGSMVLTSNLPFAQWASAPADVPGSQQHYWIGCCITHPWYRCAARATGSGTNAVPGRRSCALQRPRWSGLIRVHVAKDPGGPDLIRR